MKFFCRVLVAFLFLSLNLIAEEKQQDKPLNIIFFGNSFTSAAGGKEATGMNGVPGIVKEIAKAAGQEVPLVKKVTSGGKTLEWHVKESTKSYTDGSKVTWNYIVMQEQSMRPTDRRPDNPDYIGNPDLFKQGALDLYLKVKKLNNPKVKVVLYETWPRHSKKPGVYPNLFKNPEMFQAQLRKNYNAAATLINEKAESKVAVVAPAGDAWEKLNFPLELYARDKYHASNKGSLLNGMVIYKTIYGGKVSDINLTSLSEKLKISSSECKRYAETVDSLKD